MVGVVAEGVEIAVVAATPVVSAPAPAPAPGSDVPPVSAPEEPVPPITSGPTPPRDEPTPEGVFTMGDLGGWKAIKRELYDAGGVWDSLFTSKKGGR